MNILRGPSDAETMKCFQNLTDKEIFQLIRPFELDEMFFQLAVDKGLLNGLSTDQVLMIASEGGSLKFVECTHIQLIKEGCKNIKKLMDDAICIASKLGHIRVVEYLSNFGDIHLALIHANGNQQIEEFAFKNGAKLNTRLIDKTTDESHSVLYYILKNTHDSIAEYVDAQV